MLEAPAVSGIGGLDARRQTESLRGRQVDLIPSHDRRRSFLTSETPERSLRSLSLNAADCMT